MDHRGFASVEEMNETMIEKWNARVRKKDEVVIIGDLSFGSVQETNEHVREITTGLCGTGSWTKASFSGSGPMRNFPTTGARLFCAIIPLCVIMGSTALTRMEIPGPICFTGISMIPMIRGFWITFRKSREEPW